MQPKTKHQLKDEAAKVLDGVPAIPFVWRPVTVSVEVAGKLIGVSRTMIFELLKAGELRPVKIGKRTTILYRDLEEFAERAAERAS